MFATSVVEVSLWKGIFVKVPSPISLNMFLKKTKSDVFFFCFPSKSGSYRSVQWLYKTILEHNKTLQTLITLHDWSVLSSKVNRFSQEVKWHINYCSHHLCQHCRMTSNTTVQQKVPAFINKGKRTTGADLALSALGLYKDKCLTLLHTKK